MKKSLILNHIRPLILILVDESIKGDTGFIANVTQIYEQNQILELNPELYPKRNYRVDKLDDVKKQVRGKLIDPTEEPYYNGWMLAPPGLII